MNNDDAVWKALNAVAGKIYYEGSVDGESNLAGKAEIAEGLTASSASAKLPVGHAPLSKRHGRRMGTGLWRKMEV